MINVRKTCVAALAVIFLSSALSAIPPGTGSQHMRISGLEFLEVLPTPGWTSFTSKQVLDIPSLQVEGLILYMEFIGSMDMLEVPPLGGFFGRASALLYLGDLSSDPVGMVSATYYGLNLSPPPEIAYNGDITLAGVFWNGPLAGLVITQNVYMEGVVDVSSGIPVATDYIGEIDGFLMAPDYVDVKAVKAALHD
ncbi:MAG: hypothetical protein AB3N33_06935 [Puniceicoccaceae bacterium]